MAKIAMLSWPRLEAYRNFPEELTCTSAHVLCPVNAAGKVETVCSSVSPGFFVSYAKAVSVEPISLITYRRRPLGAKARCRGPEPLLRATAGGSLGVSDDLAGSNR